MLMIKTQVLLFSLRFACTCAVGGLLEEHRL